MDKKENLKLQESIMERIDLSCQMSEEEVRERIDEQIKKESKKRCLEVTARERLRKEIFHSIRQLGILQELIENPEITEIMVNGTEGIFIERNGKLHKLDISFDSPEKLRHVIWQITADCNRVVNEASPIVDARLSDGARVNVVLDPVAVNGPILTIRRFPREPFTMERLLELEERIHSEILDNPALEEGKEMPENEDDNTEYAENEDGNTEPNEDFSLGDYRNEDDIPDYKLQEHNRSKEGVAEEIPFSDAVSFYEILKDQLQMQELTPEQRDIAEYLIGSLDDDGLLRKNMESVMDELAIYRGIYTTEEELNNVLGVIQDFDPAGIGARSLQECLLLQIQRKADSPLKQKEKRWNDTDSKSV